MYSLRKGVFMKRIMVVDDSSIIRKVFTSSLESLGYEIAGVAKDGKEAIKMYEELQPDLVTMDVTMPIMNGIDSLKEIIKKNKDAKIIMITSHGEERLVMDAITNGAKGYILKPVTPENIDEAVLKVFPELAKSEDDINEENSDN